MTADGILPVDKPSGPTSRQAVTAIGRLLEERKAGHAGTLDPLATGLLVICLGRATLLSRFLAEGKKKYEVTALLGVETDTYDSGGEVLSTTDTSGINERLIGGALSRYCGEIRQMPPPYSAVKVNGKPLYRYARQRVAVEAAPRSVVVHTIDLVSVDRGSEGLEARMSIECGPGTYVRSIVHDLGRDLGCGACVRELRRISSGTMHVAHAEKLDRLISEGKEAAAGRLISMEEATEGMETLRVGIDSVQLVRLGKPLMSDWIEEGPEGNLVGDYRVLDPRGDLIAVYGPPRPDDEDRVAGRAVRVIRPAFGGLNSDDTSTQH